MINNMDELDKLSCKEETLEMSDLEHSATDEHKEREYKSKKTKKRRRREIDMIKLSDEDETDDETPEKKIQRLHSPGPNSPATHREPRTCVLKASQKRRPLSRLLEHLLRILEKRDPHQFFAWPVNDNFAPNYSNIIRRPMDFSTIKQKIDDNAYKSLNCFIGDFKLMCNNAMKYNKPGTVYHKAAKRLLHTGLKQLTPQKLRPLGNILTYMYEIPIRELGFDIGKMDVQKVLKRNSPIKSGGSEAEAASDGQERQDCGDSVKMHMEKAREQHRRRLAKKAFPRMDADGKTTLCVVTNPVEGAGEDKPLTLGRYIGKLTHGTGHLHAPREDRRDLAKGVKPLNYGPFSSFAPSYDGTFATLTKEESHLVYHTLVAETGNGNEELLRFAPDSPWAAIYDMDVLFPGKKTPADAPAHSRDDKDPTRVRIDVDQLRSLSELGIDVDFLADIDEEVAHAQKDYGISPQLKNCYELLQKLEKEQLARLSEPPPWHLSLCARPGAQERELARLSAQAIKSMLAKVPPKEVVPLPAVRKAMGVTLDHLAIKSMLAKVPPKEVVPLPAVRKAMGVTLDHLDTPMAVDEIDELHDTRDASDLDSRSSHDK